MGIEVGQASKILKSGNKLYAYSGVVQGGPTIPAFVTLIDILSTGLKDLFVKILPFYDYPVNTGTGSSLGIKILIDGIEVYVSRPYFSYQNEYTGPPIELFIPRQSKFSIQSINTADNTLQDRGVTVLGWYL